jgi:hypothetical protein
VLNNLWRVANKNKQKKESLDKFHKASNNFETLLEDEEDDALLEALDLEPPGTSSAAS